MTRTLLIAAVLASAAPAASAAELVLRFPNLKAGGHVSWAVYGDGEAWARRAGALKAGNEATAGAEAVVRLQLPPGRYGVMAYHDRNTNGRIDTLPIGLPTEPYGFSNDARATFGPPAWGKARFELPAAGAVQSIRLR